MSFLNEVKNLGWGQGPRVNAYYVNESSPNLPRPFVATQGDMS